jgi:DNA polymerase III epsilon subunit-like protein
MKILLLDIESAPNLVHVWGLWQQNVGLPQILASGYVLCWAAKWLGEDEILFSSEYHDGKKKMLKQIHELLDEADAVIHYNGTKFDIPTLNKEFLLEKMTPPSPFKQIDLLKTARNQFKFPSNKLDYISQSLGLGKKVKHIGHELWIKCMDFDPIAWEQMREYNIQDVVLLEKIYNKLLPWIKNHPNRGIYNNKECCPSCGSGLFQKRGIAVTKTLKYQRYQCKECGHWFRSVTAEKRDKQIERYTNI